MPVWDAAITSRLRDLLAAHPIASQDRGKQQEGVQCQTNCPDCHSVCTTTPMS
jgi:hypothetical protein